MNRNRHSTRSDVFIVLDNSDATYRAGDHVKGHVVVYLTQEMTVRDITLRLTGYSRVFWDEEPTYAKFGHSVISRKCTETYIDRLISLVKADNKQQFSAVRSPSTKRENNSISTQLLQCIDSDTGGFPLTAGENVFPFDLLLDGVLPSSCSGRYGSIKYLLSACICRPRKFDIERKMEILVFATYDLNNEPDLARPAIAIEDFSPAICCIHGNQVSLNLRLLRRGCVVGDAMPFRVEIINNSKRQLYDLQLLLLQEVVFRAGKRSKKSKKKLAVLRKGNLNADSSTLWEGESLLLPASIIPSTTSSVRAITVKYSVVLSLRYSIWKRPFQLPISLTVGTVPFRPSVLREVATRHSVIACEMEKVLRSSLSLHFNGPSSGDSYHGDNSGDRTTSMTNCEQHVSASTNKTIARSSSNKTPDLLSPH